jgi:hypothetical protein
MPDAILGLISSKAALTLISVVVGALIPIVPNLIKSKRQERREAIKLAAEAAWKDYELQVQRGVQSSSAIIFVWYHIRLMQQIVRGKLTPEAIKEVLREKDELNAAFAEMSVERGNRQGADS